MNPVRDAIKVLGSQAGLALAATVKQPTVSEWARGERPVPSERCPAIERATREAGEEVPCEALRPDLTWVRVPAEGWPNGKPVLDVAPESVTQPTEAQGAA